MDDQVRGSQPKLTYLSHKKPGTGIAQDITLKGGNDMLKDHLMPEQVPKNLKEDETLGCLGIITYHDQSCLYILPILWCTGMVFSINMILITLRPQMPMKNESFKPFKLWVMTPQNKGNVGSTGSTCVLMEVTTHFVTKQYVGSTPGFELGAV